MSENECSVHPVEEGTKLQKETPTAEFIEAEEKTETPQTEAEIAPATPKRKRHPKKRVSFWVKTVLLSLSLLSLIFYVIAIYVPTFAAFFNEKIASRVRVALAYLTSPLPCSLAEVLLYFTPLIILYVAIFAAMRCHTWKRLGRFLVSILSVFSIFFTLFVFTFGMGYHTESLDIRMNLEVSSVTKEDLKKTAVILIEKVNGEAESLTYREDGFSKMPYGVEGLNKRLLEAYEPISKEYPFIQSFQSRIKPVIASKLMSYTHITGVYSYFTGEANLNVYFPDYTLPFTAAHELAHQRGIARENEANFVAFLVCTASDDAYIRYSGYLNLLEYTLSALYSADEAAYREVRGMLSEKVVGELKAYSAFFDTFRDSAAADVSNAVNDAYLKLHGNAAGTMSYGLVVDLAVAYLKQP